MTTYRIITSEYAIEIYSESFDTMEEAEMKAAAFAKSAKMRATPIHHTTSEGARWEYGLRGSVGLVANQVNGGENETGIKRLRSIFRSIDKAGDAIELANRGHHTVATVQELRERYGI